MWVAADFLAMFKTFEGLLDLVQRAFALPRVVEMGQVATEFDAQRAGMIRAALISQYSGAEKWARVSRERALEWESRMTFGRPGTSHRTASKRHM